MTDYGNAVVIISMIVLLIPMLVGIWKGAGEKS